MGNLLGSSSRAGSKRKITAHDRAVLDLKVQRDRLKQYQKKILIILSRETDIAKAHLRDGNKELALLALKKKKYQEQLLDKTGHQLLNLEQLTNSIEFAQVELQVVEGLKVGAAVLTAINAEISLEDVEKLMADTADAIAYQRELSEMLATSLTPDEEEDAMQELMAIESEMSIMEREAKIDSAFESRVKDVSEALAEAENAEDNAKDLTEREQKTISDLNTIHLPDVPRKSPLPFLESSDTQEEPETTAA